jgi:CubicO group peptidase (beta-lactamase class C family)
MKFTKNQPYRAVTPRMKAISTLTVALASLAVGATSAHAGCKEAQRYSESVGGVSLIVMKDGEVACEIYTAGSAPERALDIASGTKSFTALMAAAAVQDGLMTIDELASETIPEWRAHPTKRRITIRHLLTLTSGLANPSVRGTVPTNAQALDMPVVAAPGVRFDYGPTAFQVFAEILDRKLAAAGRDQTSEQYLEARVLNPIGVEIPFWLRGADKRVIWAGGARITARDWAKVGELIRTGGKFDGKSILDGAALSAIEQGTTANPRYTMAFWRIGSGGVSWGATGLQYTNGGAAVRDFVMAAGSGKQRLYVSKEHGLTIVRQSRSVSRGTGFQDRVFLTALFGPDQVRPVVTASSRVSAPSSALGTTPAPQ